MTQLISSTKSKSTTVPESQRLLQLVNHNRIWGIWQGIFLYAGLGFLDFNTILSAMVYDLAGSGYFVGVMVALMHVAYIGSQLYGIFRFQTRQMTLGLLVRFGFVFRFLRLIIGASLLLFPSHLILYIFLGLFFIGEIYAGLYNLLFYTVMSRIIPLRERGVFFGLRNSLATLVMAGTGFIGGRIVGQFSYQGTTLYQSPWGYALCFFAAFLVFMVDIYLLNRMKESEPDYGIASETPVSRKSLLAILAKDIPFSRYIVLRSLALISVSALPFYVVFGRIRLDFSGDVLSALTGISLLSWAGGTYLAGKLADVAGFKKVFEGSCLLLALLFSAVLFVSSINGFLILAALLGILMGSMTLGAESLLMEFGRKELRPSYIALTIITSGATQAVAPLLYSWLGETFSYDWVFLYTGIVLLASGLLLIKTVVNPRQTYSSE